MRTFELIRHEARHRWVNSLLLLLGITVTTTLMVAFSTAGHASTVETIRLMRDIGYNLRIVPKATDRGRLFTVGYSAHTMPADGAQRFAELKGLSFNHLLAMLSRRIDWRGDSVVLTGIAQEISPRGKKQGTMLFEVDRGTVHVGFEPAQLHGLKRGDTIELGGRSFRVTDCLAQTGTFDDVRIYAHLHDVQTILDLPDRINEIQALECYCKDPALDNLDRLRVELQKILPEADLLRKEAAAAARKKQRRMIDEYFVVLLTIVLTVCGLWIAFLMALNVRERRYEIGILRALGHGSNRIAALFLGRAALFGFAGAILGYALGTGLALWIGPEIFETTADSIEPLWQVALIALVGAPAFAVAASFVPAALAVGQDPSETLRGPG